MALGAGGAFVVLNAFHYQAGHRSSGTGFTGLILAYLVVPGVLHIAAGVLGWFFPLDARRAGDLPEPQ